MTGVKILAVIMTWMFSILSITAFFFKGNELGAIYFILLAMYFKSEEE
jgi:hypothetical protein